MMRIAPLHILLRSLGPLATLLLALSSGAATPYAAEAISESHLSSNISVRYAQADPNSREAEETFWNAVKDSNDPDMIDAYLQSYPSGKFARAARAKLNEMRGSENNDQEQQNLGNLEPQRFDNPEISGVRLDSRPAAGKGFDVDKVGDAFCQRMGYPGKIDYRVADVRRTIAIEDGTRFRNKKNSYSSFRFIVCGNPPERPEADHQYEGTWATRSAICGAGVGKIRRRSDRIVRVSSADRSEYFRLGYGYDCGALQVEGAVATANCNAFYFPKGARQDSGPLKLNAEGNRLTGIGPDGFELTLKRCE